jgi:GNAT superfamily N-acetyltransferase
MTREQLLEPIVASIRRGLPVSRFEVLRYLNDWAVTPLMQDDRHVGTLVSKGTEVHVALMPGWRPAGSARRLIRSLLQPLFERHEFLTTRVRHGRVSEKRFVERLGFSPTWRDGDHQYFILGQLPFERKDA